MHFNNDRSQLHRWNKSNYNWECNLPGIKHSVLVLSSERTKKKKQKNGSRTSHVHIEYSRSHLAKQLYQTCPPQSRYGLFRTRSNPDDTAAILLIQIARSRALVKRIIRFFHGSFSSSSFFRERVIKIPPNKTNKQKKKKKKEKTHEKRERGRERKRKARRKSRGRSFLPSLRVNQAIRQWETEAAEFYDGFSINHLIILYRRPAGSYSKYSRFETRGIDSSALNATQSSSLLGSAIVLN